jgi:hypothetical protein
MSKAAFHDVQIVISAHENNFGVWSNLADFSSSFDSIELWKADVQQNYVRL